MKPRKIKILGTGKYLPSKAVTANELDEQLGCPSGWVAKKSGVDVRYFVTDETASYMGAKAALQALESAGMTIHDVDCIVSTSAIGEQLIPSNGVLLQKELRLDQSGIPAFDINSTCLSFLTGLDTMSYLIEAGRYRHVLLVSTEIASVGLNWENKESSILFGDGAGAVLIGPSQTDDTSQIISSRMETYSQGSRLSEVRGGGNRFPSTLFSEKNKHEYLFDMDGQAIFKLASKLLPGFMNRLMEPTQSQMKDFDKIIVHQGSAMAMRLLQRKLGISDAQIMNIISNHGNTISASIPMGIYEAIRMGEIKRGDRMAIIGIAAGLSLGGMILDY